MAGLGAVLLAGLLLAGLSIWWIRGQIAEVKDDPTLAAEIFPPQGEATEADRALLAVVEEVPPGFVQEDAIWGFGWNPEIRDTPEPAEAARVLEGSARLREVIVARVVPSLEPEGEGVVLQRRHDYRLNRRLHNRLAGDVLSLLLRGRHDEAVELAEAKDRHARILGRGIQNSPNLLAKIIGMACSGTLDRALVAAMERDLVPTATRARLADLYRDALEREVPLDVSLRAEFAMARRAVRAFDRRLGLLRYPLRLWWGDGLAIVDELERRMEAREPPPPTEESAGWPVILRITIPSYSGARGRYEEYLTRRRELLEALEG